MELRLQKYCSILIDRNSFSYACFYDLNLFRSALYSSKNNLYIPGESLIVSD